MTEKLQHCLPNDNKVVDITAIAAFAGAALVALVAFLLKTIPVESDDD